jgi:protein translocase SecG subunit
MTTFLIGFLTVILVLNCAFLILLVLVQLPKKEAGMGMAFGGAATETLFGSGTGTVLTKATKYSATFYVCLCLFLAIVNSHTRQASESSLETELQRISASQPGLPTLVAPDATPEPTPLLPAPAPRAQETGTAAPELLLPNTNAPTGP